MRKMENVEYQYILREFEKLYGNRIDKIQEIGEGKFILKIGKERIVVHLGIRMNIENYQEFEIEENNFIQKCRKELKGLKFSGVEQKNDDRVFCFVFEGFETRKELFFEMFGEGNAILVSEGKVVDCYKKEKWADRETRPKEEYKLPKSNVVKKIEEAVSEKYVISCMMRLPLGKKYAKEILKRLDIDERTIGNSLSKSDIDRIDKEIEKMNRELKPIGFFDKEIIIDYGLTDLIEYNECEKKEYDSLSELIGYYYKNAVQDKKNEKKEKLIKRLGDQEKQLVELKEKEQTYKK
ncbi:MAG: NFACT family protein, partial [Candidatus ainarchaeum sp.]|nr:NFACT family protein [Candidatus ainarchaeum sp.]